MVFCGLFWTYNVLGLFVFDLTGMPVRAINRPGSQLLGTNGRDDGPIVC